MKNINSDLTLSVGVCHFSDDEMYIINQIKQHLKFETNFDLIKNKLMNEITDTKQKGNYGKIINYVKDNINLYGMEWMDWVLSKNMEEYEIINSWLEKILRNDIQIKNYEIKIMKSTDESKFRHGPWAPSIRFA